MKKTFSFNFAHKTQNDNLVYGVFHSELKHYESVYKNKNE